MANLDNFDANEVDPSFGFDPIPTDKYLAVIIESEFKKTKSGTGQYLNLTFEVIEGQYKGRKVWARLNLANPNQTAVKIARAELSAVCHAVGVMKPADSCQLHDLPLVIKVKCKRRKDSDDMENVITGYERKELVTAATPAPQATTGTAPWKR